MKKLHSPFRSAALPAVTAALVAAGLVGTAQAQLEIAGSVLISLDATSLPVGPVSSAPNTGDSAGVFEGIGGTVNVAPVHGNGTKAFIFNGNSQPVLQHRVSVGGAIQSPDAGLVGGSDCTIEAWVINPAIEREETILAWGRRGGPDGSNMSFNYGWDARFGAVGHWGSPDIGWDSAFDADVNPPGIPLSGVWHHLVYTYDGTTQRLYADGVLKNQENVALNIHGIPPITIGGQLVNDAGGIEPNLRASMAIGRVRIHQGALSPAQVLNNYNFERADFNNGGASIPVPEHRYPFNNAAGPVGSGTVMVDTIAGANGTLIGTGANATGTRVTIPGGAPTSTSAYIDLPNGMLSKHSTDNGGSGQVTFEGFIKITGNQSWSRVMDFGSSSGGVNGEVTGSGGGGEGRDYLFYAAQEGGNTFRHNVTLRNADNTGGSATGPEVTVGGSGYEVHQFNRDLHFAITWHEASGDVRVYENGTQVQAGNVNPGAGNRMSAIRDVNVWLGRSNWAPNDNLMQGEFDEFRVYNTVLTPEQVFRSFEASAAQLPVAEPPSFTRQPLSQTVQVPVGATFFVETRGEHPMTFQWMRDNGGGFNPIPGATNLSYTLASTVPGDNNAMFKCVASNFFGGVPNLADSAVATLTVLADTQPPTLVGSTGGSGTVGLNDTQFGLRFSEPVNATDAVNLANYSVSGGVTLLGAVLLGDNITVVFQCAASLNTPTCKEITVNNVRDRAFFPNTIAPNSTTGLAYGRGSVRYHQYNNTGTGIMVNDLLNHPKFSNFPDAIANPTSFQNPNGGGGQGDTYGAQIVALVSAPYSGDYRFYLSADDGAALYLSTDMNPANKVQIAREPEWAGFREYTGNAGGRRGGCVGSFCENVSAPIPLQAGCRYYIEAIYKENNGGDHVAVAWQLPGGAVPANGSASITGDFLTPYEVPATIAPTDPADLTVDANALVTLTADITGSPVLTRQWHRDGVPIPDATNATLSLGLVSLADNGARFHVTAQNSFGSAISRSNTLTVVTDATLPTVASVICTPSLNGFILQYSEQMDTNTSADPFAYTIPGVASFTVEFSPADLRSVRLVFPQTAGTTYEITIDGVSDLSGNAATQTNVFVKSCVENCGPSLRFETYNTGGGVETADLLIHPTFPNSPDSVRFLNSFDTRAELGTDNFRDNYGGRLRGVFVPPASGNYIFYLHSDDAAQLWLNPNGASAAGRVLIAEEIGCCRDWPAVASYPIALREGQPYYIEGLFKEGGGGDYIRVAAQLQGSADPLAAIPASQLGRYVAEGALGGLVFNTQPQSQTVNENSNVAFTVAAQLGDFAPVTYQWQRDLNDGNGFVDIPGATGATYAFSPVPLAYHLAKFRAVACSIGARSNSAVAVLSVTADLVPPTITSIRVNDRRSLEITFSELMHKDSVEDEFNYSINGGSVLLASASQAGLNRVILETSADLPCGMITVVVDGARDASEAQNLIASSSSIGLYHFVPGHLSHRYSFNSVPTNDAVARVVADTAGTADGSVKGLSTTMTGSRVTLPGGTRVSAGYVDLPNGLVSSQSANNGGSGKLTVEGWVKITGVQSWSRIFDFGANQNGEITTADNNGGDQGVDYFFLSAMVGGDPNTRQVEFQNRFGQQYNTTTFGQDFHFAVTWDESTSQVQVYENGALKTAVTSGGPMNQVNDVNVWLGRSNWTVDSNMQGEFDEFRLHRKALSPAEIAASIGLGPDPNYGVPLSFTLGSVNPVMGASDRVLVPATADFANIAGVDASGSPCIVWSSTDPVVASVTADGYLRALRCGTATITAVLENFTNSFSITVTNCSPVAQDDGGATGMGLAMVIAKSKLLRNDSDPENDPLSVTGVSATSTNGGSVTIEASTVTYTPLPGFSGLDRFTYTVSDGRTTDTGEVVVLVVDGAVPSQNQVAIITTPNGVLVRFAGIPGRTYVIERAPSVSGPWSSLTTIVAPIHGIMEYEDTSPLLPSSFYRTVVP